MMYNTYNFNQYLGHNELNRILNKEERLRVKYVVYYDGVNIIYFTRGDSRRRKMGKIVDNFYVGWLKEGKKQSLLDLNYFTFLKKLGEKYGYDTVWEDWNAFSLRMISNTEELIKEAERLNNIYPNTKIFWIIMGMVMYAEDIQKQRYNKKRLVYLKRNMKRLAAYQILRDKYPVKKTVNLTKEMSWKIIKKWLIDRGIYVNLEYYDTPYWDDIYDKTTEI